MVSIHERSHLFEARWQVDAEYKREQNSDPVAVRLYSDAPTADIAEQEFRESLSVHYAHHLSSKVAAA